MEDGYVWSAVNTACVMELRLSGTRGVISEPIGSRRHASGMALDSREKAILTPVEASIRSPFPCSTACENASTQANRRTLAAPALIAISFGNTNNCFKATFRDEYTGQDVNSNPVDEAS